MHGIFWMVIGHFGTCYRGTQPPQLCTVFFGWSSATLVHATVVFSPHGNARYFLDGNRPLRYMLPWYSVTTVMSNIFCILFFGGYSRVRVVLRCQYVHRTRKSPDLELEYEILYSGKHHKRQCPNHKQRFAASSCVCAFSSHLFWTSNSLEVPARVTQDFPSTFLLRCVPLFFWRERFSRPFPSSTVKLN